MERVDTMQGMEGTPARPQPEVRVGERLRGGVALLGFDLILLFVMTGVLVVAVLVHGGSVRFFQPSVGYPLSIMGLIVVTKLMVNRRHPRETVLPVLRDWLPFVFVSFIYENLYVFSKHVMTSDISPTIFAWDVALFGVEPTVWIQQFAAPWLTDVMTVCYALYFVLPLGVMFFLSLHDRRWWLRHMATALTLAFLMGFVCYIVFPCNPPRYLIPHLYPGPLSGVFLYEALQNTWDGLSVISGAAFPSLHVGISSIALIYAWWLRRSSRLYRTIFVVTTPLVIGLWVSTIYLRHHWAIDIFAGWAVALLATWIADRALRFGARVRRR